MNAGRLTHYPGGYQYYLDKTKAESARAGLTATGGRASVLASPNSNGSQGSRGRSPSQTTDRKDQKRVEAEHRQARSRQRKAQQQIVHRIEKEIQGLEARQAEIIAELEKPETYEQPGRAQEINRELMDIQHRLAELNPAWEQEATRLAALDR